MSMLVNMETLDAERGIARVVLDSPKVNAMGSQLLAQLAVTFEGLAQNDSVRGILLEGNGSCLSAGLDLKEVVGMDRDRLEQLLIALDRMLVSVFTCPTPIATVMEGHAIAGGMVIALATDHVALRRGDYRVGLTELAVGVPFPRSAYEIVACGLPPRAVRRFVLQPDTLSPEDAYAVGFGDTLGDSPRSTALTWLRQAAALPPAAVAIAKLQIRESAIRRIQEQADAERPRLLDEILSDAGRAAMARALAR
ncbi:MAG: enoyl-CoA hydratase [Planctomycetes bacterium]|nr:enoyl-CoA hydratase [Planctomycetota bacterium]